MLRTERDDGFAILLVGTCGSFPISQRISAALDELAEPQYEDDDTGIAVSASVGIVSTPVTTTPVDAARRSPSRVTSGA